MKYQIHGFQQSEALRLGINDRDLLYLRWFIDFKGTEKMVCHTIKETHFYWVNYQALIDDHPCLEIRSRETISRRFNKMVESGILIKYLKKDKKGTYTLFAIGPEYLSLADSKKVECKELAPDIFVESTHSAPDKKVDPKDPNTNNNPNTNISTSPIVEVNKPKKPLSDKDKLNIEAYERILKINADNNYIVNPDSKLKDYIYGAIKREGPDRVIKAVKEYWKDKNSGNKYAGKFDTLFYKAGRLADYANKNDNGISDSTREAMEKFYANK